MLTMFLMLEGHTLLIVYFLILVVLTVCNFPPLVLRIWRSSAPPLSQIVRGAESPIVINNMLKCVAPQHGMCEKYKMCRPRIIDGFDGFMNYWFGTFWRNCWYFLFWVLYCWCQLLVNHISAPRGGSIYYLLCDLYTFISVYSHIYIYIYIHTHIFLYV